jgi:ornithine cyclodeaminase/alanine dehydrogenase-like protein (mu-crystallin family)
LIFAHSLPESLIAPYLTSLQERLKDEGIRIGSYPVLNQGVYVSLIGSNQDRVREIGKEVEKEIQGNVVSDAEVVKKKDALEANNEPAKASL